MSYLELPFFNQMDLDKLDHYEKNIVNLQNKLETYERIYNRQNAAVNSQELEQEIKNIKQNIFALNQQIQNVLARVSLNVTKAIEVRLQELSPESEEYKLLIKLKNDLKGAHENWKIDLVKMREIYKEYENTKWLFSERNKGFIFVLQNRLRELESNFNQSRKMSGLDITTSLDGTIILKSDLEEYNSIVKMIKMLEDLDLEMIELGENIYLKQEHLSEFKNMASHTKFFAKLFPEPREEKNNIVEEVAGTLTDEVSPTVDLSTKERIEERARLLDTSPEEEKAANVVIPNDLQLGDVLSDKNILFKAIDQYVAAKKEDNRKIMLQNRDFIMKMTGINIDDYLILKKDLDEVRQSIVEYLSMNEEDYIAHLREVIREFHMLIDEGLLPSKEINAMERDILLIEERINDLKPKQRR